MALDDNLVLARSAGLTWIRNKEGIVFEKGFALNDAAAAFFLAIDGKRSVRTICEQLQSHYEVEYDELSTDMLGLAHDMIDSGLLAVVRS